jgi:hypothetical protein
MPKTRKAPSHESDSSGSQDLPPLASEAVGVASFEWLGQGRRRNGVLEYRGFRADTQIVTIGDIVTMDSGNADEAFIGWITRLFEDRQGQMQMDAKWFYRANDLKVCLGLTSLKNARSSRSVSPTTAGYLAKVTPGELFIALEVRRWWSDLLARIG